MGGFSQETVERSYKCQPKVKETVERSIEWEASLKTRDAILMEPQTSEKVRMRGVPWARENTDKDASRKRI